MMKGHCARYRLVLLLTPMLLVGCSTESGFMNATVDGHPFADDIDGEGNGAEYDVSSDETSISAGHMADDGRIILRFPGRATGAFVMPQDNISCTYISPSFDYYYASMHTEDDPSCVIEITRYDDWVEGSFSSDAYDNVTDTYVSMSGSFKAKVETI